MELPSDDASAEALREWVENLPWAPSAQASLVSLRAEGIEVALALDIGTAVQAALAAKLGITHVWPGDGARAHTAREFPTTTKLRWVNELAQSLGVPYWRTAAVGTEGSDLELLEFASLPFWVEEAPFPGTRGAVHLPQGDITEVTRRVLGAWLPETARH